MRRSRTRRRSDEGPSEVELVGPFVSAVDLALTSLRGQTRVSDSTVAAMFSLLSAAVEPGTDAAVEYLVRQGREEARGTATFPTTALADRLLDLRSAATTGVETGYALIAGPA